MKPRPSEISELEELAASLLVPRDCELLVFGSAIHGTSPNDLDLLVVYRKGARPLARELAGQLEQLPELGLVHLTMLTIEEELEVSFAAQVSAVHVAGDVLVRTTQ